MNEEIQKGSVFPQRILNYAGFWERAGAALIDITIVLGLTLLVETKIPLPFCWIFSWWLYESVQITSEKQATIGQRIMSIKVCNTEGGTLDPAEATLRHFTKYISLLFLCCGYILFALKRSNQCFHDKVSDSSVVSEESYQAAI